MDSNQDFHTDREENERKGFIPESVKKILSMGMGAAFLTEETVKSVLGDSKLPKEVLGKLMEGANRSKEEIIDRVGDELVSIIKKIDFVHEASRFVEDHKFKINAEIEITRRTDASETALDLKTKTKIKDS